MNVADSTAETKIDTNSNLERILAASGVVAATIGSFVVGYFNPVTAGFFPVCPLYQMTGFYCPGCGLTRGFHALFHGDVLTALHYNALLPIFAFLLVYLTISLTLLAVRGRGLSWKIFAPNLLYSFMILAFVFSIARNLPFYPFTLLAP